MPLNNLFYSLKPIIPRRLQIFLRRKIISFKLPFNKDIWPIDKRAGKNPEGWSGWPEGKKFALVLMHDVDTQKGHDNCNNLMKLEMELGFRSTFFFVPERYNVSRKLLDDLRDNGFNIGVHGLKHDGKLFTTKKRFLLQAIRINKYLKAWNTRGFSSPSMHRNFKWMYALDIDYATSSFDTDPFEPQPDGIGTIFPFVVNNNNHSYIELPYTLPQDYTLFILMKEKNITIWKKKVDWIVANGGMVLFNTHPDYMHFDKNPISSENYPANYYYEFLQYMTEKYKDQYWHSLSKETTNFFNKNINNL